MKYLKEEHFPEMEILSLSGNFCVDKKPSALNWYAQTIAMNYYIAVKYGFYVFVGLREEENL